VGGGIVWDSVDAAEFEECRTKALVLTHSQPPFSLLETMLWEPEGGFFLLDYHIKRLMQSGDYFSYPVDIGTVRRGLVRSSEAFPRRPQRVRLLISRGGEIRIEHVELPRMSTRLRICPAKTPVHSTDVLLYHKTTARDVYREKLAECPGFEDVLLWNEHRELTESCIANIIVEKDNELLTPRVSCGLLAGTYRQFLLESGKIREAVIGLDDLAQCGTIYLVNSVRKMYPITLS
jgi:para-aminobenzoate synthetase/4-amino-4-deoxychorismate lyase